MFLLAFLFASAAASTPVVLWHGMGDNCCNPMSMGSIQKLIQEQISGVYVLSLRIGGSIVKDTENGFLMPVNDQIDLACKTIAEDPKLKDGYHAIGFSQGGQFLRAVAQRCPSPPMINLISVGGQHQGVNGMPHCGSGFLCNMMRKLLDMGAYNDYVQGHLVQAQYWHDPLHEDEYKEKSQFLAEVNNENVINATYKENLEKLKNFVLIKFLKDSMVIPKESEWFGFYAPGQATDIQEMNQTALYQEDRLGLKALDESGKLHFLSVDGDHLRFSEDFFIKEIVKKYLI